MTEKKAMHIYKTVQAKIFAFARFLKAPYLFPVQSLVKMMTFIRTNLAPPPPPSLLPQLLLEALSQHIWTNGWHGNRCCIAVFFLPLSWQPL